MNSSSSAVKKVAWRFTGIVLLLTAIGTGTAGAATFQSGGSTATIEQSGGGGTSHSQVIRNQGGQTVITQNGNSTDITVQRHSGVSSSGDGRESLPWATDRFDRGRAQKRLSHRSLKRGSAHHSSTFTESTAREDFQQQMLERMQRPTP